jgi:hypothetical protein
MCAGKEVDNVDVPRRPGTHFLAFELELVRIASEYTTVQVPFESALDSASRVPSGDSENPNLAVR